MALGKPRGGATSVFLVRKGVVFVKKKRCPEGQLTKKFPLRVCVITGMDDWGPCQVKPCRAAGATLILAGQVGRDGTGRA